MHLFLRGSVSGSVSIDHSSEAFRNLNESSSDRPIARLAVAAHPSDGETATAETHRGLPDSINRPR